MATFARGLVLMTQRFRLTLLLVIALSAWCVPAAVAFDYQTVFDAYPIGIYSEPELGRPDLSEKYFAEGLKELWSKALDRPDADLRRMVIDTLANAHRHGVKDLVDTRSKLIEILNEPDQEVQVIRAIAATLVAFDSKQDAPALGQLAIQHGSLLAPIVEPAIAKWKSPVLQDEWIRRISNRTDNQTSTLLAINGLSQLGTDTIKNEDTRAPLQQIVLDSTRSIRVRMAAAKAIGTLDDDGLLEVARGLATQTTSPVEIAPILAIELLGSLDEEDSIAFLVGLLDRKESIVQANALGRLHEIDSLVVAKNAPKLLSSSDANVRRWCARGLVANCTQPRVASICSLLNDTNPSVRNFVAKELVRLHADNPDLADEIAVRAFDVLYRDNWQGCEQASVVLASIDHKQAGERMVELLSHPRAEVQVAAAWGLSRLQIAELLPAMHEHAKRIYQLFQAGDLDRDVPGAEMHLAHVFYTFGTLGFDDAEPLLRNYIPKQHQLGDNARGSAIWAIGMLHEGSPDTELEKLFIGRMTDASEANPEVFEVQQMSAISLGRMTAKQALPSLREIANPYGDPFSRTAWWAINRITGEEIPPFIIPPRSLINDWFLAPL